MLSVCTPGWHITAGAYCFQIPHLLCSMLGMRDHLLPENRGLADRYLQAILSPSIEVIVGLSRPKCSPDLQQKYATYTEMVERRLQWKLDTLKYNIDAVDTVFVISGTKKLEQASFASKQLYSDVSDTLLGFASFPLPSVAT